MASDYGIYKERKVMGDVVEELTSDLDVAIITLTLPTYRG